MFYFLVVYVPERRKRRIVKDNLRQQYRGLKSDIMWQVIFASQKGGRTDLEADHETVEDLLTIEGYRKAFDGAREGHEGIHAFCNGINADGSQYRAIVWNLQVLAKQIDYVLHNYTITDAAIFDLFKHLEVYLLRLVDTEPGYDEAKGLSIFIEEIFGGFSVIEGCRGYDIVEKMIEEI